MAFTLPTPAPCDECGSGAIFHRMTYVSIVIDEILSPFSNPNPVFRWFSRLVYKIEHKVTPRILEALMSWGWARRVTEADDDTQLLALMLWNEAKERGIEVSEFRLFNLPRNIFVARFPDGRRIAYEGIPIPTLKDLARVRWMDNKAVLKEKFRALGLPVAKGGAVSDAKAAKKLAATLTPPLIAKPFSGSASRHTTLHLMTEEDVLRGFRIGKEVAPWVVIEEELIGPVYRATVVDGKFAAAIRRDQPHVMGDDVSTIRELVERANEHPKRSGPYFHQMKLDDVAEKELAWQGLTFDSVLPERKRATLHQKINWSVGGTTTDVTDDVHPENIALFEEIARVLNTAMVGIDFIVEDISRSWKGQERCGILECNSMPFFDNHHLPFEGKPRNVAALIWDMNASV